MANQLGVESWSTYGVLEMGCGRHFGHWGVFSESDCDKGIGFLSPVGVSFSLCLLISSVLCLLPVSCHPLPHQTPDWRGYIIQNCKLEWMFCPPVLLSGILEKIMRNWLTRIPLAPLIFRMCLDFFPSQSNTFSVIWNVCWLSYLSWSLMLPLILQIVFFFLPLLA